MKLVDRRNPVSGAARTGPEVVARIEILGFDAPSLGLAAADLRQRVVAADLARIPSCVQLSPYGLGQSLERAIQAKHGAAPGQLGKGGEKTGNVMWGTDFTFSTATDDAAGGNSFLFAPILAVVLDMPFYGFFAALNLYYFDVFKDDSVPATSRYVGRWFYMQPLTKPGPWYGGLFLLPEFQPVYDFETEDYSSWFGLEIGKLAGEGKIAYIKPGWGINNSEPTDRKSTFEAGFRWFF